MICCDKCKEKLSEANPNKIGMFVFCAVCYDKAWKLLGDWLGVSK